MTRFVATRRTRQALAAHLLQATAGLVLAASVLSLATVLAIHWFILPHIDRWRSVAESRASAALGVPVRIGALRVADDGWLPTIEMRELRMFDPSAPKAAPALRLPLVMARVSAQALWVGELRFAFFRIERAELDVRRDGRGRLHVAGFELAPTTSGGTRRPNAAVEWLFHQPSVSLDAATLRWTDDLHGGATSALTEVHALLRNGLRSHDLDVSAAPPADIGAPVALHARFTHALFARVDDWSRWSGRIAAELPRVDLAAVATRGATAGLLPQSPVQGSGQVHALFDVAHGELRSATLDLALRNVVWPPIGGAEALTVERLDGQFSMQREGQTMVLAARHARLSLIAVAASSATATATAAETLDWPLGNATLTLRSATRASGGGEVPVHGELVADSVDLALLSQVVRAVPITAAVRADVTALAPRGSLRNVRYAWDGSAAAPTTYRLRTQLRDIGVAALAAADEGTPGRPGVRNASGNVDATEAGGTAEITIADGNVALPGLLAPAELPVDHFEGRVAWRIAAAASAPLSTANSASGRTAMAPQSRGIVVELRAAHLRNADAHVDADATWFRGAGMSGPGHLALDASIPTLRADRLGRYLPLGIPLASRLYMAGALRSGELRQTRIRIDGGLRDFPFYRGHRADDGMFRLTTHVDGAVLAYVPSLPANDGAPAFSSPWPAFAEVSGDVAVDRGNLQLHAATARWADYRLSKIEGHVDDMGLQPVLALQAHGTGPLADLIGYVNATPLGSAMDQALEHSTASGQADLDLALTVPLTAASSTAVVGKLAFGGCDLRIAPGTPLLGNTRGRIAFTEHGLMLEGVTARVLGGEASIAGGDNGAGGLRFTGTGVVTADGLQRAPELGWLSGLAASLSGGAHYAMALGFAQGQSELDIHSDLVGVASNLPAPLAKRAQTRMPFHYQTSLLPAVANGLPRDTMRIDVGNVVQATYRRELPPNAPPKVLGGAIGIDAAAPALPASGVAAKATFADGLDIDAWRTLGERWAAVGGANDTPASASAAPTRPASLASLAPMTVTTAAPPIAPSTRASTGPDSAEPLLGGYAPTTLALQAAHLRAGERRIDDVQAELTQDAGLWRADVHSQQVTGHVEYRVPQRAGGGGRLYARLARLSLPPSEATQVERLLGRQPADVEAATVDPPASLPALDVAVDDFELRDKRLGRLEVVASNRTLDGAFGRALVREWQLQRLSLFTPEARFTANGRWLPAGGNAATSLDLRIDMSDAGALLDRFGSAHAIAGGHGSLAGRVAWAGSPFSPDTTAMSGQLHLNVDDGRFLKVDPGAARLLGVLSLQALPRRLLLDFRDVFAQGFVFDSVVGDVHIDRGVASTNNLRMRGVQAAVLVEGQADIERETQQLHVVVVPEISAGTATLAYAVINPAIGLGAFLAQLFLHKPLAQAGTREFAISGPWDDPKVERLDRPRPAGAAAAASAATSMVE